MQDLLSKDRKLFSLEKFNEKCGLKVDICNTFKLLEGEEQNREEGEMAQTKLGGGRNRGKK